MHCQNMLTVALVLLCSINFSKNAPLSSQELKNYKNLIEGQGLYSSEDDVNIITAKNFKKQIYGNPYAIVVEFYNSWCGFCQRFAPSWKALASDIKGWRSMISVGVIDCSDDDNAPICRDFEIMAYPTLRYFHENYEEGPGNIGTEVNKGEDVYSHKVQLIKKLISEQVEGRGQIYPNLLPYQSSNADSIYDDAPVDTKYIILIVEEPPANIGPQIILDLKDVPNVVVKYAFSNNTNLTKSLHISKFPTVLAFSDDNNNIHTFPEDLESREAIRNEVEEFLNSQSIIVPEVTTKKGIFTGKWVDVQVPDISELMAARQKENLKRKIRQMGDVVFQADLETALRYSLKHEVGLVKTITGEKLTALINYITVLKKYFPFGVYGQHFLNDLLHVITRDDTITGDEITKKVMEVENDDTMVFSSSPQWLGCSGSMPSFRGYPCGMWTMFHYLTVNAADQNANNENANPLEVLDAMHGYIKNFFGCSDCSRHFQEMAEEKDMKDVSSLESSVLWLWMAHNTVNKRLAGDATEDPEFPKIQFPLPERCSSCRNSDSTWNLPEVLQYLKNVYGNINIRYLGTDTRISQAVGDIDAVNGSTPILFRNVDKTRLQEKNVRT